VHLIGTDRFNPSVLLDVESKKVVWDVEAHTNYTFPHARKYMVCKFDDSTVHILLKSTGKAVARGSTGVVMQRSDIAFHLRSVVMFRRARCVGVLDV